MENTYELDGSITSERANFIMKVYGLLTLSLVSSVARNPSARTCLVRIEVYQTPTMAEYRDGKRPVWATATCRPWPSYSGTAPSRNLTADPRH